MEAIVFTLKVSLYLFILGLVVMTAWYLLEKIPFVQKVKNWFEDGALETELQRSKHGGHNSYQKRKLEAKKKEIDDQLNKLS